MVGFQKSILESAGILCFIRNEHTSASMGAGMMGLFQSHIFDPVLCIVDDDRYEEAVKLIAGAASSRTSERPDWKCPVCGEQGGSATLLGSRPRRGERTRTTTRRGWTQPGRRLKRRRGRRPARREREAW